MSCNNGVKQMFGPDVLTLSVYSLKTQPRSPTWLLGVQLSHHWLALFMSWIGQPC